MAQGGGRKKKKIEKKEWVESFHVIYFEIFLLFCELHYGTRAMNKTRHKHQVYICMFMEQFHTDAPCQAQSLSGCSTLMPPPPFSITCSLCKLFNVISEIHEILCHAFATVHWLIFLHLRNVLFAFSHWSYPRPRRGHWAVAARN